MPTAVRNCPNKGYLEIDWSDGHTITYLYKDLRVLCPCAGCRGHAPDQAKVISGKEDVKITHIELVGNYAIRLAFDDGHGTGLYTFKQIYNGEFNR
ncbi:MAG: DUF971 domain-containing protein [Mariprofundaceae bacterium]|nr:DUF971 domain-containing protein [Mariprofundaceae bacterium]